MKGDDGGIELPNDQLSDGARCGLCRVAVVEGVVAKAARYDGTRSREQRAVGDAHGHRERAQAAEHPRLAGDRGRFGDGLCR